MMTAGENKTAGRAERESSPGLNGLKVLVLRPEGQTEELAALLRAEGAEPLVIPAVRIVSPQDWSAMDGILSRLDDFRWLVFTSVNGVDTFIRRLRDTGRAPADLTPAIAAIGPATRLQLEKSGIKVDWTPKVYTTSMLADHLPWDPPGRQNMISRSGGPRVCLLRADIASADLEKALRERGFHVERINVYGTQQINTGRIREALGIANAVVLTSASIARSFAAAARGEVPGTMRVYSIGPATSQACRSNGLRIDAEAAEHTVAGLVEAIKAREPAV